ncbi:MAG: hypothetical protein K6B28_05220 [Lachnospiraceae bacterium]|nr:hypothetical protein [Lachnospiraceae bacterium]
MDITEFGTIHIDRYYSSLPSFIKRYERNSRNDEFKGSSIAEYEAWAEESRIKLKELIKIDRIKKCDPYSSVEERVYPEGGIIREKVVIETEEDVFMSVYILIPKYKSKGTFLALPGHQGGGKYSVAGCYDIPAVKEKIDFFNYDYGMKLCRLGYIAVCPDARGFGERRDAYLEGDEPEKFLTGSCRNLANMALPMGLTVIGLLTYDNMRLIDYLESRGDFDLSKLGCIGFSGGGMQTLYLAALDDRIKQTIISGYFYGFRDSLMILNGNCSCNYVPDLFEHFDMGDILSLYAPKPLLIQSCKDDHLNGPRGMINVYEQMDIIKRIYNLFGKEEFLRHDIREGEHHFHDEMLEDTLKYFDGLI